MHSRFCRRVQRVNAMDIVIVAVRSSVVYMTGIVVLRRFIRRTSVATKYIDIVITEPGHCPLAMALSYRHV